VRLGQGAALLLVQVLATVEGVERERHHVLKAIARRADRVE